MDGTLVIPAPLAGNEGMRGDVGMPDEAQRHAYTVEDVAKRLQVDIRTVYAMMKRGELRGVKVGRVWRIPAASLDAFLDGAPEEPAPKE